MIQIKSEIKDTTEISYGNEIQELFFIDKVNQLQIDSINIECDACIISVEPDSEIFSKDTILGLSIQEEIFLSNSNKFENYNDTSFESMTNVKENLSMKTEKSEISYLCEECNKIL